MEIFSFANLIAAAAGSVATITTAYALWVSTGQKKLRGIVWILDCHIERLERDIERFKCDLVILRADLDQSHDAHLACEISHAQTDGDLGRAMDQLNHLGRKIAVLENKPFEEEFKISPRGPRSERYEKHMQKRDELNEEIARDIAKDTAGITEERRVDTKGGAA